MTIRIVSDSTSGIDRETAEALGISVVAQSVQFGTRSFKDGITIKRSIIVRDGAAHPLGRSRTFPKAISNLKKAAREFAPIESLAVSYSTTPDVARKVADDLKNLLPEGSEPYISRLGPALGVYAGLGAVGISLIQAEG